MMMQTATTQPANFVETLYKRAENYFETQPNKIYITSLGFVKSILLVLLYAGTYCFFLFAHHSFSSLLATATLLGLWHVLLPVNIGHDAIHQTLSSKKWINDLALYSLELTGANSFMYRKKHLEAHRNKEIGSQINAIETQQLLLQTNTGDSKINLPYFFYLFYAVYMIYIRDFQLFYSLRNEIPTKEWLILFATKFSYAVAFLLLPFLCIELPTWQIACSLAVMYMFVATLLVIILLMPTEKMKTNKLSQQATLNDQWVKEILEQDVDFSPSSRLLNLLVGGTNLNVIHYLFPNVHHVHYNKLAEIVEKTAIEYKVNYRKQSVIDVIGVHVNYIRNIQRQDENVAVRVNTTSPSTT
ncbi:MAG: fatty acid desaturase [Chitinophagaceae bacterium]|nr:MAG: fatty acid desaturase [Chitinophagaceae bacterium]